MDTINDPVRVKALLDQLRDSQAWRDTVSPVPQPRVTPANTSAGHSSKPDHQPASVASLLSLLHSSPSVPLPPPTRASPPPLTNSILQSEPSGQIYVNVDIDSSVPLAPLRPHVAVTSTQDLRSCSFQQALPHLARLSSNPDFVSAISEMKREQAGLERLLWDERRAIQQKHETRVKVALTKAGLIGSEGLSQYEADIMTQAFNKEISKFDMDRVLPAWGGLMSKHQTALEALGCPAMYVTNMTADLQRQQRVIQVLEGIIVGEGS